MALMAVADYEPMSSKAAGLMGKRNSD